jgi:ribosomal protein S18 acetylase RimI-like enzyme
MPSRSLRVERADGTNAGAIADLRNAAADRLDQTFGKGHWSGHCTERGVLADVKAGAVVFVACRGPEIVGTMTLGTRKPWAIDPSYFTPAKQPLHLTNMAVHPAHQRCGVGRLLLDETRRIAAAWPADAVRLDAFDADAGAGPFYAKCGFREVGRRTYRTARLIYYELLV